MSRFDLLKSDGRRLAYLFGRLVDLVVVHLLIRGGWVRRPGVAAWLFQRAVHPLCGDPHRGDAVHLLVLTKAMFNEDVLSAFGPDPRFCVYGVHRQVIKAMARPFLSVEVDDNNYVGLNQADEQGKEAYRGYAISVLKRILTYQRYDAVLTANYAYYAEREWAAACEAVGIAFLAQHKENIRSPGFAEFMEWVYRTRRGPFTGRRVLVYNELEKGIECRAGVAEASQITVTGMPRMDRCHAHRQQVAASGIPEVPDPVVLLFSFGPKTLLPGLVRKMSGPPYTRYREPLAPELENLGWHRLFTEVHGAMLKLAQRHPDITVRIKTKGVSADKEVASIQEILKVDRLPPNLEVVCGGDPLEHIIRSAVVCGFNTTALLESVAIGVPVIVPRWGEYVDPVMCHYVVDFEDAVRYADTEDAFIGQLAEAARARLSHATTLTTEQSRMLEFWLGNADGNAGDRVREAVLREIGVLR